MIVAFGAFLIAGAMLNWEWFMNNYKSRRLVELIGRNNARIIYGIVGGALIVAGALFAFGVIGA